MKNLNPHKVERGKDSNLQYSTQRVPCGILHSCLRLISPHAHIDAIAARMRLRLSCVAVYSAPILVQSSLIFFIFRCVPLGTVHLYAAKLPDRAFIVNNSFQLSSPRLARALL